MARTTMFAKDRQVCFVTETPGEGEAPPTLSYALWENLFGLKYARNVESVARTAYRAGVQGTAQGLPKPTLSGQILWDSDPAGEFQKLKTAHDGDTTVDVVVFNGSREVAGVKGDRCQFTVLKLDPANDDKSKQLIYDFELVAAPDAEFEEITVADS
jgi:hypothetical protein